MVTKIQLILQRRYLVANKQKDDQQHDSLGKCTMRYHFIPSRMVITKKIKIKITRVGGDVEKLEPLCIAGGNVKWCSPWGKRYGDSPRN